MKIDLKPIDLFNADTFKVVDIPAKGVTALIGKIKNENNMSMQSYTFSDIWTEEKAAEWVKEHGNNADWLLGKNMTVNEKGEVVEMEKIKKNIGCEIKEFDDIKLSFDAIASTENKDRDGDILLAEGWNLKNFKKNPVMLWGHRVDMLPVGKAVNPRIEGNKLVFKAQFMPADINPIGEQLYKMFKAGYLSAFSVRFEPISYKNMERGDNPQERYGRIYEKQELLEISPVTVPSNPYALVQRGFEGNMFAKSYLLEKASVTTNEEEIKGYFDMLSKLDSVSKPEPDVTENYIRIRQKDPASFIEGSFRTVWISEPRGIKAVMGKLKNPPEGQSGSMVVQSYLFDKEKWNLERAQAWVAAHKCYDEDIETLKIIVDDESDDDIKSIQDELSKLDNIEDDDLIKTLQDAEMLLDEIEGGLK